MQFLVETDDAGLARFVVGSVREGLALRRRLTTVAETGGLAGAIIAFVVRPPEPRSLPFEDVTVPDGPHLAFIDYLVDVYLRRP